MQKQVDNYSGDKSSKDFTRLNKKLSNAISAFKSIDEQYTDVQNALTDLSIHNKSLYDRIENLTDPAGTMVTVYAGIQDNLYSDVFGDIPLYNFSSRKKLNGISDASPGKKPLTVFAYGSNTPTTQYSITSTLKKS